MFDPATLAALLAAIGLGAGVLGSMIGVGGGIVMVPALTFLGLGPTQVASTSLFAVSSTSVSSTVEFARQKRIDYRLGILMAAVAVPGAVLGALVSVNFTADSFKLYFSILMILSGLYMLYRNSLLKDGGERTHRDSRLIPVLGAAFAAGIISSLFGVGGGIIFVPAMLLILGIGMHRATATSQLTLMATSIAGLLTHIALGHPDYYLALALSAGAFIGAQIGARLSKSAKDVVLQKILGLALIAVGGKLMLDWFLSR